MLRMGTDSWSPKFPRLPVVNCVCCEIGLQSSACVSYDVFVLRKSGPPGPCTWRCCQTVCLTAVVWARRRRVCGCVCVDGEWWWWWQRGVRCQLDVDAASTAHSCRSSSFVLAVLVSDCASWLQMLHGMNLDADLLAQVKMPASSRT